MGKDSIDDDMIGGLRRIMDEQKCKRLLKDLRYTEDWIYDCAKRIAQTGEYSCNK